MLVIQSKSGSGIKNSYSGDGIFDFGRVILKKALSSNLIKKANQAINSKLGKATINAVKEAAQSDLGQALKRKAISEVKKKVFNTTDKVLDRIHIPVSVKKAARSELGQKVQKNIISEIGKRTHNVSNTLGVPVEDLAQSTFQRLGIAEPPKKRRKVIKNKSRKKKGEGFIYPQQLISQFGSGIILE